jgi:hypothetical protein
MRDLYRPKKQQFTLILNEKSQKNRALDKSMCRWEKNIKMNMPSRKILYKDVP